MKVRDTENRSSAYPHALKHFTAISAFIVTLVIVCCLGTGLSPTPQYGLSQNVESTRALWQFGTPTSPLFDNELARLKTTAIQKSSAIGQDLFTLSKDGALLPKQSLISSYLALPFFAILGEWGFVLFQGLCVLVVMLSVYILAQQLSGPLAPLPAALLLNLLTAMHLGLYSFFFWYDIHGMALLFGGAALALRFPVIGSVMASLAVLVRPSNALLIPFLCLFSASQGRSSAFRVGMGLCVGAILAMSWNYFWFGAALSSSYQRVFSITGEGKLLPYQHKIGFSLQILRADWGRKLFGAREGWLLYNPIVLLVPLHFLRIKNHPKRLLLFVTTASALVYTVYIFSYQYWYISFIGNRFLLPATFTLAVVVLSVFPVKSCRINHS